MNIVCIRKETDFEIRLYSYKMQACRLIFMVANSRDSTTPTHISCFAEISLFDSLLGSNYFLQNWLGVRQPNSQTEQASRQRCLCRALLRSIWSSSWSRSYALRICLPILPLCRSTNLKERLDTGIHLFSNLVYHFGFLQLYTCTQHGNRLQCVADVPLGSGRPAFTDVTNALVSQVSTGRLQMCHCPSYILCPLLMSKEDKKSLTPQPPETSPCLILPGFNRHYGV